MLSIARLTVSRQSVAVAALAKQLVISSTTTSQTSITPAIATAGRFYITRAHPQPTPEHDINNALEDLLLKAQKRQTNRARRQKQLAKKKKIPVPTEIKHPDETVELCINLNLDPRKPGQALRGSITLPNGSGKTVNCVVFTSDDELKDVALNAGALQAGGEALVDQIVAGEVPVESFQRAVATKEMMPILSKKAARLLGPRGLMPNPKVGTLLPEKDAKEPLLALLDTMLAGKEVTYRTEKEGIVHVPVGKVSFGPAKLLENIGQVMQTIFDVKPESFGKGKKGSNKAVGKGTKYLLKASLSSTQGPGIRLDLRTVDPTSAFFLTGLETTTTAVKEPQAA